MTLEPDTREILRQLAELGVRPMHELTVAAAREQVAATRPAPTSLRPAHEDREFAVPIAGGLSMRVKVVSPPRAPKGLLVYLHGGGWVVGTIEDFEPLCRELAAGTGCAVAVVDYRLAPEHAYPAAVEDAYRAVVWATDAMPELIGRRVPLIVAGDSAGANLAAVVAQRSRAAGGPEIALQVLVYPVTDADTGRPSYVDPENQLLLQRETMQWFWQLYAPDAASREEPAASPLRAPDLTGLPPAVVVTAEHDVLRDEGEAYARRLEAAGVPVNLRRFDGHIHGFLSRFAVQPSARAALDWLIRAVGQSLIRNSSTASHPGVRT
jgi:acetyl esterase